MKNRANHKTPTLPTPASQKKMTRFNSAPLPCCFPPSSAAINYPDAPPSTTTTTTANLTTSLYHTHLGIFSLTWSRTAFTRSLHLHLHTHPHLSLSSPAFHLTLKPLLFWNKQGFKKLPVSSSESIWVFWDLSNTRFGSGPDPESGFYIAALYEGAMTLLVGDLEKEAYSKTRAKAAKRAQALVLRREHVMEKNKFYTTRTYFGGKSRLISIELSENCEEGTKLAIRFDQRMVFQVKHLKWKFRGSERIDVDGHPIQLSWDAYNWLFEVEDSNQDDGYALFTFRIEKQGTEDGAEALDDAEEREKTGEERSREKGGSVRWTQDSCGLNYERKEMKKKLMAKRRSPSLSLSSISSVSSGCSRNSSVLEWESVEENELKGPTGFSLLVYAWKG